MMYLANTLPFTRLSDIVTECEIILDSDPRRTTVPEDQDLVDLDLALYGDFDEDYAKHVVRLTLHQHMMKVRNITPPLVRTLLRQRLHNKAHIISSETNSTQRVVRIRFRSMRTMMSIFEHSEVEREAQLPSHRDLPARHGRHLRQRANPQCPHARARERRTAAKTYVVDTQGCASPT